MSHFLRFCSPNSTKNQNFEKMKKTPGDIIICIRVPKFMIRWCTVPEIWCVTDVIIISHYGQFFAEKNQNFEKMQKTSGDIIILHMCIKNYNQMMYGSWDVVRDRCNCYFSFWAIFCPFTLLAAQKNKILKKWKKCLKISF